MCCLDPNVLQNIYFCVLQKTEIHTDFSLYYLYKVQSKNPNGPIFFYINKNLIG